MHAEPANLRAKWAVVLKWQVDVRYATGKSRSEAADFLDAAAGRGGVIPWLKSVLVMEQLSPEMIDSGRELVQRLAQDGMKIRTALWLFSAETGRWSLVLASPEVRTAGPLALYRKTNKQLKRMGEPDYLPVYRIAIVDPKSSEVPLPTGSVGAGRGLAWPAGHRRLDWRRPCR